MSAVRHSSPHHPRNNNGNIVARPGAAMFALAFAFAFSFAAIHSAIFQLSPLPVHVISGAAEEEMTKERRSLGDDGPMFRGGPLVRIQTADEPNERRRLFPTSHRTGPWTSEQVARYERGITPEEDPKRTRNLLYADRNLEQFWAESENGREVVRYLSNAAGLPKATYGLLIRVRCRMRAGCRFVVAAMPSVRS